MMGEFYNELRYNAKMTTSKGGGILPIYNRYVSYRKLVNTKNLKNSKKEFIRHEFQSRGMLNEYNVNIASKVKPVAKFIDDLKANEEKRLDGEIYGKLVDNGIECAQGMKLLSKIKLLVDTLKEKNDGSDLTMYGNDYKKYFKQQSNAYQGFLLD